MIMPVAADKVPARISNAVKNQGLGRNVWLSKFWGIWSVTVPPSGSAVWNGLQDASDKFIEVLVRPLRAGSHPHHNHVARWDHHRRLSHEA